MAYECLDIPANRPDFIGIVPIYNFQNGQKSGRLNFFFFFLRPDFWKKGGNRHRPCLDLQYINFKYENCVSLAFKIAKSPWPPATGSAPGPPAIGCPDFEYPNVGRYALTSKLWFGMRSYVTF